MRLLVGKCGRTKIPNFVHYSRNRLRKFVECELIEKSDDLLRGMGPQGCKTLFAVDVSRTFWEDRTSENLHEIKFDDRALRLGCVSSVGSSRRFSSLGVVAMSMSMMPVMPMASTILCWRSVSSAKVN